MKPSTINHQPSTAALRLRRTLHPETRVIDSARGIVEYVASDETLDSYQEVIRASGWRFNHFAKNAPFVDSHQYDSISHLVGKVVDFKVTGKQLVETVQWARDVEENQLARIGWAMTEAGYLKAVSVGFFPTRMLSRHYLPDAEARREWDAQLKDLGLPADKPPRAIFLEQEQIELSSCIIGANPNALARAYKDGAIDDQAIEFLSLEYSKRETALSAATPADVDWAARQARARFVSQLTHILRKLKK